MASPSRPARKAAQPLETLCATCGHAESQHGTTGSRPCLAMSGDLLTREFCTCDAFTAKIPKAA